MTETAVMRIDDQGVRNMYNVHIFPKRNAEGVNKIREDLPRILAGIGISLEDLRGKTLLDAGCGTGEVACFLASQGARVTAIDFSTGSLNYARALAKSQGIDITFIEGSLLDYPFPKEQFDYVFSHMVLHHTSNPAGGFANIVKALKPGGSVIFRVFCFWGTFCPFQKSPLWKRWIVWILAGTDPERRVRVGERLFYRQGHEGQHGVDKATYLYDLFGVRIVYHHWWGELLGWLKRNRIDYHSSYPPMEFAKLAEPYLHSKEPSKTALGRALRGTARVILTILPMHRWSWSKRPTVFSRFLGQTFTFFSGANMSTIRGIKPSRA